MDFELRAAKAKWEREQRQRKEQARARLERERKAKEEALKQREALEAEQRHRRIQEAEASAAARQQEESDLFAGDGVRFNEVLEATLVHEDGDKIRLPPSVFEHLSSQGALEKGPMFFEITLVDQASSRTLPDAMEVPMETRSTHAGVLQFTAPKGFAELPLHVWLNAGLKETSTGSHFVRVRYVRLPKCTYAKLQSEASDFADVPNHKAVLETKLRQHATLSQGDLLEVHYGGVSYNLLVLELKPSPNVSVLETDMEVDVVEAASSSIQRRLVPIEIGKPLNGAVEEGCYNYYKLTIEEKLQDAVAKGEMIVNVYLEVSAEEPSGDADLYVACHPILFPTQHHHQWASHDVGSKVVHLTGTGKSLESNSFSIGVFGFRGIAYYKLWVQSLTSQHPAGQKIGAPRNDQMTSEAGFEVCGNCRQAIPAKTLALHEAYCRRHNAVCEYLGCGAVLRREDFKEHVHCPKCGHTLHHKELEKHLKVYHEPQSCACGAVLEREKMVNHQATSCPLRMITCRFCGDMVQAGTAAENIRDKLHGLTQHESVCGARTAPCDSCGRAIMLKEMDLHIAAAHTVIAPAAQTTISPPNRLPTSTLARNDNIFQAVNSYPQDGGEQVQSENVVCPICSLKFEGLSAEGKLNMHLDTEHFSFQPDSSSSMGHLNGAEERTLPTADHSFRSSLSVSCPICGLAVHSERDLSSHMDMVH